MEQQTFLKIHPEDNVLVALRDLEAGYPVSYNGHAFNLASPVKAKHKFTLQPLAPGDDVLMYGVLVGKATHPIALGEAITTTNVQHASDTFGLGSRKTSWTPPNVSAYRQKTFLGYHRPDGKVGTANYWIVIPMVFCENRNVETLQYALTDLLGYGKPQVYRYKAGRLVEALQQGATPDAVRALDLPDTSDAGNAPRVFNNVDGVKFLMHDMGCGGTRADAEALCGLLAGYITHPNVAGATILSLGCQHAQVAILEQEIARRDPGFAKPLIVLEQQKEGTETQLLDKALKLTFAGLMEANQLQRQPAPLNKLVVGLECGGSDGFSGISANPAVGYTSDMVVALGGSVVLSEFPELCGVEQELSDRCIDEQTALRFNELMTVYNNRAEAEGSGFHANPSPGNIRDGLITDAIKSAGAAKKGGTSPVVAVLDYPEPVTQPGLSLLCTPGNDVESTTAEVGSGANIVLFTTGLGTPTGNPIAPVIKISTNTALYNRMPDIIDINCGTIIEGTESIEAAGERILNYVIAVASGEVQPAAVKLGQDDFIPWRRGISL
ncbi:MAG: altronate dehydratase family protein [Chitinophagaceae bacterium]|nr:altronate dehydratase family protein [Chitinophagaceae bacterium]